METQACPVCGRPLETLDMDGLSADFCAKHGIWLTEVEYGKLMARAGAGERKGTQARKRTARRRGFRAGLSGASVEAADRTRRWLVQRRKKRARAREQRIAEASAPESIDIEKMCPVCGATMRTEDWHDLFKATSDVTIDKCEEHGVWFDTGELDVLVERARKDADRAASSKVNRSRAKGIREGEAERDRRRRNF